MTEQKLVLGLAGMPGSGKSLVVQVATTWNYDVVVMGDIVRTEANRRGFEPTPENIGKVMLELRKLEGSSVIAKRCIPKIEGAKKPKVIVDGIRSLDEVEEFKKHFRKFKLVTIHSSPEGRFRRLYRRQRSDDADCWETFHERDLRELGVGLGSAMAMAEYVVINDEPARIVKDRVREVLRKVDQEWTR